MKAIIAIAALIVTTTFAQAGDSYSFEIGGRSVFIHAPSGCDSPSCLSVSIPGVFEYGPRRAHRARNTTRIDDEAVRPAENNEVATARPLPPPAPAPAASNTPPSVESQGTESKLSAPPQASPSPAPATVVATAPAEVPIPQQQAPATTATPITNSPIGLWLTEENEGKVRIEQCGTSLCGYSIDARTGENKDKVLINMRPTGAKWSGRIHDPKGGSTYDSTIALKSPDRLRVQGCAFGGMFCGGQTWSRVN